MRIAILFLLLAVHPVFGQDTPVAAENPLAALKAQVDRVLAEARLPFSEEQDRAIVLMMEDRRQASEDLFGDLFDFSGGPTQGQDADRLRSAIDWLRNEFLTRLRTFLTPEQLAVWDRFEAGGGLNVANAASREGERGAAPRPQNQTQFVRINNNAFTAEDSGFRFGRGGGSGTATRPEVIQRGGVGAYHGTAEFLFKDESLNAGRRFANNKPAYQERQASVNVSGPLIPGRLTTTFIFTRNEAENVDTIRATLPEGVYALGITRPNVNRNIQTSNTYQLSEGHSLTFNAGYQTSRSENQNVGGFTLPERASESETRDWNFEVRQFSSLSPQSIFETRFNIAGGHSETTPATDAVRINVLDAFSSGGAQNRAEDTDRTYTFSNLYTRLGERLTVKTGLQGVYRSGRSFSENNFGGTFTFSTLQSYIDGRPIIYRVNRGDPRVETTQLEMAFFMQNDWRATPQLTLLYGLRYEVQTNISDHNNLDPRVGVAYAIGRATVIRGGAGIFHERFAFDTVEGQRRLDGVRQYEVVIDNPSYPDPSQSGTIRNSLRSIRVTDADLATPYGTVVMASVERTFFTNLFLSAQVDINRLIHRYRNRNINAPLDVTALPSIESCKLGQSAATCLRPFPDQGNILNVESTGKEFAHYLRLNYRQRFSVFTVSANYTRQTNWSDTPQNLTNNPINVGFSPEGLTSDNYNIRADWTRSAFPVHNVNTTVNAQLPFGIFLTNTMSANNGTAYTIITGTDDNKDTAVNDRPVGLKRNSEKGPPVINFNFNISKAFFLGRAPANGGTRSNVNLFANMTNAFNRPNYARPSGIMTSPNFGKSTSAGDPREIEVGMRFQF